MADLEFVDQHNMVACLEKTGGNSKFYEIVDFLTSSLIHHALTVSLTIYISYVEQFWNTASSQTVNDEKQIHATVDNKAVVVIEVPIKSSLLLNDVDGTACLTNEAIFQNLALMGYEGELNKLTFQKALFSPQWKYLIHTILHCLSSKSTSWNEFSTNIASAVICLATNQKFNFSKLVFDGMLRNLDTSKKKFLMYPRFLMVFLNNQIELGEPFNDVYVTPAHTQKVFSNMSRKGVKFSRKVTPLFDSMLVPHQAPEGEGSDQPIEPQPTPSPTQPSTGDQPLETSSSHATTQDSRDSLEGTNGNEEDQSLLRMHKLQRSRIKKLEKKCKPGISHHRAWLKSVNRLSIKKRFVKKEYISKQGRKKSKPESTLDDSAVFDDQDADHVVEDKGSGDKGGNAEELVSTARLEVSTARLDIDAARQEDSAVEPRTPLKTTSIFDNEDITMAQTLIKMKEEKAKEKGVSIKDVDDSSRLARSILTLNPLPTIDPKDKGKGVLKESLEQERDANFVPIGSKRDEKMIDKMNKKAAGMDEEEVSESTKVEVKKEGHEENIRKRSGRRLKMKDTKKSKGKNLILILKKRTTKKLFLKIVPDEEEEIDYEVLGMRYPIINWESAFYHTDRYGVPHDYYRVFRANGSSRYIKTFTEMVSKFDRLDFIELHSLVMQRFSTTTLEGIDLVLWGDLRVMFEETADDDIWKIREMIIKKRRYLLIRETLERMMELRLIAESEGEAVLIFLNLFKNRLMSLGAKMGVRRIFECWFSDHITNGHQFTMSNRHQELASPEANGFCAPCYSNEALAIPDQTATDKEISIRSMAVEEDCWVLEDFTTYCCWFNIGATSEDLVLLRKIEENRLSL
ncbi:hypothetical protein Tco_0798204 [Tanacetum coccineum]